MCIRDSNYHVFYQLCRGAAKGLLEGAAGMGLAGAALEPASHGYSSGCADVAHLDDAEEFQATVAALDALGVRSDERERIFRVAAAVAWLGDVAFVEAADDGSAVAPGDEALAQAAKLLGVCSDPLVYVHAQVGESGLLALVYLVIALLGSIMSNQAVVILLYPVLKEVAGTQDLVSMKQLVNVLVIGSSSSFLTPFSYQTNLLVQHYYEFSDFLRVGSGLTLLLTVATSVLVATLVD